MENALYFDITCSETLDCNFIHIITLFTLFLQGDYNQPLLKELANFI